MALEPLRFRYLRLELCTIKDLTRLLSKEQLLNSGNKQPVMKHPALQELHAAFAAGANSGLGRNADAVFSRLRQKYQDATTKGVA